jgi:hypothetical protein
MFGMSQEKPKNLGFKETSKAFRKEIRKTRKIKNEKERLADYQQIKADLDSVFENADADVQRAAEKADPKKDGAIAYLASPAFAWIGIFGTGLFPPIYSMAVLAPLAPILVPAIVVATEAFVFGCRHLLLKKRGKEVGMTVRDVKYAQKMKAQQVKMGEVIKAMTEFDAEQPEVSKLAALREKYSSAAARKPANSNTSVPASAPAVKKASTPSA